MNWRQNEIMNTYNLCLMPVDYVHGNSIVRTSCLTLFESNFNLMLCHASCHVETIAIFHGYAM